MKNYLLGMAVAAALITAGVEFSAYAAQTTAPAHKADAADEGADEEVITGTGADGKGIAATDPEANTTWNKSPQYLTDGKGGYKSIGLKSFEGIEEPTKKFVTAAPASQPATAPTGGQARRGGGGQPAGQAVKDDFVNITEDKGVVKMFLRDHGDWWDGDQGTDRRDRQRAEIKGLGPHQKDGETFEYGTTFRLDPDFKAYGRFCHIMQLKATDGDKGAPLVVLSLMPDGKGALRYVSGNGGFKVAQEFTWKAGEWITVKYRVKVSQKNEGGLTLSVNGGEFKGVQDIPMFRPQSTEYRPKWGLYRGVTKDMKDDWIEHKDCTARKL